MKQYTCMKYSKDATSAEHCDNPLVEKIEAGAVWDIKDIYELYEDLVLKELKDNSLIDDDVKELSEIDNTGGKTSSYLNASNKPRKPNQFVYL